jgi:hypothetical protein
MVVMHTLAPSVDRLGAALRALRQVHAREPESEDETLLGAQCLHVIIPQLAEEGLQKEDLQPLIDLEASLRQHKAQAQGGSAANRRKHRPPSEDFLARVAAVIDLLVKGGSEEGEAAQMVMRRLMAAGVPPPQQGGDARGWRRLLEWRTDLGNGLVSAEAQEEYQDFTRQLEAIPANERLKRVFDEHLWDRRRKPR